MKKDIRYRKVNDFDFSISAGSKDVHDDDVRSMLKRFKDDFMADADCDQQTNRIGNLLILGQRYTNEEGVTKIDIFVCKNYRNITYEAY